MESTGGWEGSNLRGLDQSFSKRREYPTIDCTEREFAGGHIVPEVTLDYANLHGAMLVTVREHRPRQCVVGRKGVSWRHV